MPNLLQGVKIEYNIEFLMQPQEDTTISDLKKITNLYKQSNKLLGSVPQEFKDAINKKLRTDVDKVRNEKWKTHRGLPEKLVKMYNCEGEYSDILTALNALPKVKISEFRRLADKFNMVIIPVEYTEINKIFDTQKNSRQLKQSLEYFNELLRQDTTTKYQSYLLCPIDYYNVWEQIKNDKILKVYYPDYFENIFSTLELIIPTQKNLYLASKTNDENLKALSASFDANIKTLNDKITSVSNKINKLELEFIEQQRATKYKIENLQAQNSALQSTVLQQQRQIEFLYCQLDPILFSVPEGTNVVDDDITSIVGLCWGEDIDEMIFDMKGITIHHKDLAKINPLNIKSKMAQEKFELEYGKIVDMQQHVLNILQKDSILQELNEKREEKKWGRDETDRTVGFNLAFKNYQIFFHYTRTYNGMQIDSIQIRPQYSKNIVCSTDCNPSRLYSDCSNQDFYDAHKYYFEKIANLFTTYCKDKCLI